jgi:hypothetical protein
MDDMTTTGPTSLEGLAIVDTAVGARGRIVRVADDGSQVLVEWKPGRVESVELAPGRYTVELA